jgi:MoaE-MoaD fusion protein
VKVTVRLFAMLRERAGCDELSIDVAEGACAGDVIAALGDIAEGIPLLLAVNHDYARRDQVLSEDDELALIPPVSGGEAASMHTQVTQDPLSLDALLERVRDPRAGAVVSFQGVTRSVERLDYEAYREMADKKLSEIVAEVSAKHGVCAAAAEHRVGSVPLSEPSVCVCVSAPHRPEAFAAAREIIDRLKSELPIWKKEIDYGDQRWVEGTEPRQNP